MQVAHRITFSRLPVPVWSFLCFVSQESDQSGKINSAYFRSCLSTMSTTQKVAELG